MTNSKFSAILAAIFLLAGLMARDALAEEAQPTPAQLAWQAAGKVATRGPADVALGDQATLHLPRGMDFIPKAEATTLMKLWGNSVGARFMGLVISQDEKQNWVITVDHTADGYVKDEDAKNWNADDLLQSIKEGTAQQNEERAKQGIPALDIVGWIEPPSYDATSHRLVWSMLAKDRGAAAGAPSTVNYNTYALGRDGYFEMNLLTSDDTIGKDKSAAHDVLAALEYKPGKRYEDFNASTDHIAEYGLAALIGGVVANKLGLFALAGLFIAKFIKIILVGLAVAGGAVAKFFRRNKTTPT
jgi:uncharacterized membrane-anchored protein